MIYHLPPNPSNRSPGELECPKCGRHSIVMHGGGRYVCLSCDWFRDLNYEQEFRDPNRLPLWLLTLIVLLLVVFLSK